MTNLFLANAEIASCFDGTIEVDPSSGDVLNNVTGYTVCPVEKRHGCYQRVEGNTNVFGCASEIECSQLQCCVMDSCNDPKLYVKL
jgi:hypothetical protein